MLSIKNNESGLAYNLFAYSSFVQNTKLIIHENKLNFISAVGFLGFIEPTQLINNLQII